MGCTITTSVECSVEVKLEFPNSLLRKQCQPLFGDIPELKKIFTLSKILFLIDNVCDHFLNLVMLLNRLGSKLNVSQLLQLLSCLLHCISPEGSFTCESREMINCTFMNVPASLLSNNS